MKPSYLFAIIFGITGILGLESTGLSQEAELSESAGTQTPGSTETRNAAPVPVTLRGSDVLNAKVFGQTGDELGHIRDILLDPGTGDISYAVMGTGGWVGFGERLVLLPWDALQQDVRTASAFVIKMDPERVKSAPSFEEDQWATVIQPGYLAKVRSYFSEPPNPKPATEPPKSLAHDQQEQQQAAASVERESQAKSKREGALAEKSPQPAPTKKTGSKSTDDRAAVSTEK